MVDDPLSRRARAAFHGHRAEMKLNEHVRLVLKALK